MATMAVTVSNPLPSGTQDPGRTPRATLGVNPLPSGNDRNEEDIGSDDARRGSRFNTATLCSTGTAVPGAQVCLFRQQPST